MEEYHLFRMATGITDRYGYVNSKQIVMKKRKRLMCNECGRIDCKADNHKDIQGIWVEDSYPLKEERTMTKQYPVIEVEGFLYAVDDDEKARIPNMGYFLLGDEERGYKLNQFRGTATRYTTYLSKKIIASNNPALSSLPIIPLEDDVQQLAKEANQAYASFCREHPTELVVYKHFIDGYKAASAKKYTEEDMKKACSEYALDMYDRISGGKPPVYIEDWWKEYLKSLKPSLKAIEVEMEKEDYYPMKRSLAEVANEPVVYNPKLTKDNHLIVTKYVYSD